jgi:hypothetical protein
MIEQEIRNIWKNAAKAEQIKLDLSKLMIELNARLSEVNQNIKKRDFREIAAALFGIPLHIYFYVMVPYPITRIGLILIMAWFVYIIFKLKSTSKLSKHIDLKDTYINQLKQQKNYLNAQANLLNTVLFWYVLPPFIGNVVCIFGAENPEAYGVDNWLVNALPLELSDKLGTIAILAVFYGFIYWMNKKAAKKNIKPIIEDIQRIEREFGV